MARGSQQIRVATMVAHVELAVANGLVVVKHNRMAIMADLGSQE